MTKPNMSQRKIDGYLKLAEVIQWGRKHPVKFVERENASIYSNVYQKIR